MFFCAGRGSDAAAGWVGWRGLVASSAWNDEEDAALAGLPLLARVLYLQGIRRHMDYATGIVGEKRGISYQSLREVAYVEPMQGSHDAVQPAVTYRAVRHAIDRLEKEGLLERRSENRRLIFFLPLASWDQSASNMSGRGAAEERQTKSGRPDPNNDAGYGDMSGRGAADQCERMSVTPPESVIRKRKKPTKKKLPEELIRDANVNARCAREILTQWLEYKQASKNPYNSAGGVTAASNLLARTSPESQALMVEKAISGNWQGLPDPPKNNAPHNQRPENSIDRARRVADEYWGSNEPAEASTQGDGSDIRRTVHGNGEQREEPSDVGIVVDGVFRREK